METVGGHGASAPTQNPVLSTWSVPDPEFTYAIADQTVSYNGDRQPQLYGYWYCWSTKPLGSRSNDTQGFSMWGMTRRFFHQRKRSPLFRRLLILFFFHATAAIYSSWGKHMVFTPDSAVDDHVDYDTVSGALPGAMPPSLP